jgi:hypothetical protein
MPELKKYNDFYTMSEYANTVTDKKLKKIAKEVVAELFKEHIENQGWYRAEFPKRRKS